MLFLLIKSEMESGDSVFKATMSSKHVQGLIVND